MSISEGTEVYNADVAPVTARGVCYTENELNEMLADPVSDILADVSGTMDITVLLQSISSSNFEDESIARIMTTQPEKENWRVGEAIAEAFLVEHRSCVFPWPTGRDLRNPNASPAGCDLVGLQDTATPTDSHRFAFGEVKTSDDKKSPPGLMHGRSGLKQQLEGLRDSKCVKDDLVKYLMHRARDETWFPAYMSAAKRYISNASDVSIYGILIRDVPPNSTDISARARSLSVGCPPISSIELRAMYLPMNTISTLSSRAIAAQGGGHAN